MDELVRWETEQGPVIVEVGAREPGFQSVSRPERGFIVDASERLETALGHVRGAAESALRTIRSGDLNPDVIELEFGVKFNASAGAVIAKTSGEGHLKVKLTWGAPGAPAEEGNASGGGAGNGSAQEEG